MKCPKCQHENPSDARFCNGCGQKLEPACSECGKTNPPGSRFCNGCGHSLSAPDLPKPRSLSFDEKITKIQNYLPEALSEKILSQRDRIEGERRQVTVMFCDMEGYTSISEKLGPEGVYTLMDQVYEILIHKVNDFGGTVNELTGDGIMALFGAPVALEDAPQRAIRSALSIHKEITRFSERMSAEKGVPPFRMRAGIHSGPVVVGTVGKNLRVDFKAVGDTVNLASRMESIAEPGTTYVTEDTFKLTEGLFRFEALGERAIKGKAAPIKVYQVIAPSSRRTRFDVSAERGLTSFVGRELELELLLDGFTRAKEGNGHVFSIIGEAGIGKSRFLYEFRKAVSNEDITFLEGKCLSYGKGVPYHPIIDVLKGNFNIGGDDTDDGIRKKIEISLEVLKVGEATTLPYVLELLGVKDSGIDRMSMSPEGLKERIIEAVRQIILKGAQIRPLIIAIEDLMAFEALEEALSIASEEWDLITLILSSLWLGVMRALDCDFERARSSLQRAVDINVAANNLWGIASMKAQLAYFCYFWAGSINSLVELSSEALKIAEESGDPISRGISHTTYGVTCLVKGHLEDAKCHILEGTNLCGRVGMYGWEANGYQSLAETYFQMKDYHESRESCDQAIRILEADQISPSSVRLAQLGMTRCGVMLGESVANLESLRAIPGRCQVKVFEGWTSRFLGEIFLNLGGSHVTEAEHWIRKAIEADKRNGMRFHLGLDYALYGDFFSRHRERAQAQENLGKAIEILKECGADGWIEKCEKEMAKLT